MAELIGNIDNISFVKIDDFEIDIARYNPDTKKHDIYDKELASHAFAVLGVKPNWIQLVVHRPIHGKRYKRTEWVVSERETSCIVYRNGSNTSVTKEEAVLYALAKLEKNGKENVMKLVNKAAESVEGRYKDERTA